MEESEQDQSKVVMSSPLILSSNGLSTWLMKTVEERCTLVIIPVLFTTSKKMYGNLYNFKWGDDLARRAMCDVRVYF